MTELVYPTELFYFSPSKGEWWPLPYLNSSDYDYEYDYEDEELLECAAYVYFPGEEYPRKFSFCKGCWIPKEEFRDAIKNNTTSKFKDRLPGVEYISAHLCGKGEECIGLLDTKFVDLFQKNDDSSEETLQEAVTHMCWPHPDFLPKDGALSEEGGWESEQLFYNGKQELVFTIRAFQKAYSYKNQRNENLYLCDTGKTLFWGTYDFLLTINENVEPKEINYTVAHLLRSENLFQIPWGQIISCALMREFSPYYRFREALELKVFGHVCTYFSCSDVEESER